MKFLTVDEVALKLKISTRRVAILCEDGRFKGAYKPGNKKTNPWLIPENYSDPRKDEGRPKKKKK